MIIAEDEIFLSVDRVIGDRPHLKTVVLAIIHYRCKWIGKTCSKEDVKILAVDLRYGIIPCGGTDFNYPDDWDEEFLKGISKVFDALAIDLHCDEHHHEVLELIERDMKKIDN